MSSERFDRQLADITAHYEDLCGSTHSITIWLEFSRKEGVDGDYIEVLEAQRIEARGKGDEAMRIIGEALQEAANKYQYTFVHIASPTNDPARNLLRRTEGYEPNKDETEWRRSYIPQVLENNT